MKVAVLVDAWYPIVGGGQVHIWEITKRIALRDNCQIEIITRKLKDEKNESYKSKEIFLKGKLKIIRLGVATKWSNFLGEISFLLHATVYLLVHDFDIIHVHPFLSVLPAKVVAIIKKKPIVLTVHGTRLFEKENVNTLSILLEKYILTKIRYNLQISVTSAFLKIKNSNKNVIVIPNGVDIEKFAKSKTRKSPFPKILWVGRFDHVKRVEDLLIAVKIVSQKINRIKLFLVGYGYEISRLKSIVKKLKLSNKVEFTGRKEGEDLISEYKSAHLFVLSSTSEGQPLSLLEAQAAALPIVATNVGGIPEIVKDGMNGLLVPPGEPTILAKAIMKALKKKKNFGKKSFENSKKFLNWDKVSKLTFRAYEDLIK